MKAIGTKGRLASVTAVVLLALAVVPLLASSASAGAVPSSVVPAAGTSAQWAYGGQGWSSGSIGIGAFSLTWNATAGADVIYNETNTSATTTELTVTRTVMEAVTATYSGPNRTWTYHFKLVEVDHGYANLTDTASVTLANSTVVAALGILNASLHATVSLQASLVGSNATRTVSDYLNASGWANAQVAFSPALGLVPLNLTGVTSWSSSAAATGSAAWNISWTYVNQGWNGTTASKSGYISGSWSTATEVTLVGRVGTPVARWVDHRLRTGILIGLTGPFDLYAGVLLVPHGFDLFSAGARADAASGLGTSASVTEYLFVTDGPRYLTASSFSAGNLTATTSTPVASSAVSGGSTQPAVATGASPDPTAWEQPESVAAAQSQASCFQTGCPGSSSAFGGMFVVLVVGVVAVAVAVAVVLSRRPRGRSGVAADSPLTPGTSTPAGPTPPGQAPPSA